MFPAHHGLIALLAASLVLSACSTSRLTRPPKDICQPSESEIIWIWSRDKADFERALAEHFGSPSTLHAAYSYAKPAQLYVFPAGLVYTQQNGYETKTGRRRFHESLVERTQTQTSLLHALALRDLEIASPQGWVETSKELQEYAQTFAQGAPPNPAIYAQISAALCEGN